jgi:hypothetical protein
MFTTTGVLLIGCLAAVFGALLRGSAETLRTPDAFLFLGAAVAFSLVRRDGRP